MGIDLALKLWHCPAVRVLVVGDLIIDVDVHGSMERYAQESPSTPIFRAERQEMREGGAGAVTAMAQGLGAVAVTVRGPHTSRKHRYFAGDRMAFRADGDVSKRLSAGEEACVVRDVKAGLDDADVVLIADYGKGLCTKAILRAAIDGAKEKGVKCIVDPAKGRDWRDYSGCSAIKCNSSEWSCRAANDWRDVAPRVIITRGANGLVMDSSVGLLSVLCRYRQAADVTGAGDMVLAALGTTLAGGMAWEDCCRIANGAAGLKVERRGAVPVTRAEVVLDLLHGEKTVDTDLLDALAQGYKTLSKKVVLTNGCFDIIHRGHCEYLAKAKALGDVLIVGVNSDASVRRLKGESRPINCLAARTAVLSSLECVDHIVGFDEDLPNKLIGLLSPTVFAKGGDYSLDRLPEAALVRNLGGEVHILPLTAQCSTTRLIENGALGLRDV